MATGVGTKEGQEGAWPPKNFFGTSPLTFSSVIFLNTYPRASPHPHPQKKEIFLTPSHPNPKKIQEFKIKEMYTWKRLSWLVPMPPYSTKKIVAVEQEAQTANLNSKIKEMYIACI